MKVRLGITIAEVVISLSTAASADGPYTSIAAGGAHLDGGLARLLDARGELSARFALGVRVKGWALEGALGVTEASSRSLDGHHQVVTLNANLARYLELSDRWELFARVGGGRAGIGSPDGTTLNEYDGFNVEATVGAQYGIPLLDESTGFLGHLRFSLEVSRQSMWMSHPSSKPIRGGATHGLLGISIGF